MSVHHGDCLEVMPTLDAESIDAIVTDPPYGIGFMGKAWDGPAIAEAARKDAATRKSVGPASASRPGRATARSSSAFGSAAHYAGPVSGGRPWQEWCERWAVEALRVAKPGAYLLAFGGTRTVHRMTCAIEDAGWIIRDMLVWGYASGFPKGRANLKPAWEPIVMARKPGPLRPLAIDECRIPFVGDETPDDREGEPTEHTRYTLDGGTNLAAKPGRRIKSDRAESTEKNQHTRYANPGSNRDSYSGSMPERTDYDAPGRWPANVLLTSPIFDGGWDGVVGGGETTPLPERAWSGAAQDGGPFAGVGGAGTAYHDSGTYSRFFLIPKAARSDREPVLRPDYDARRETAHRRSGSMDTPYLRGETMRLNPHPTVKPVDLMRHLVRLVTPPGGTVLDPFLGSGTTALAAEMEGFAWVGIEREAEYVAIAEARLNGTQKGMAL